MAGVPMRAGDPLVLNVQLHNPTDRSYRGVTVRLVLAYTTRRPDLEVHGFRIDVMFPTGYMVFDLPPGRSVWTWEGSPGFEGRVFALTGHVHRYAEWIVLEDVTERRELYRAEPTMSASGAIVEMPVRLLSWGRGYVMRPSHRYRLTASYFNPTDQPIVAGGVANVGGIYAPEDDLPPLERTGTAYSRNLSVAPVECGSTTSLGAQLAPLPAAP
jgi:hypothetical protein